MDYFACNGNIGYWRIGIIFFFYATLIDQKRQDADMVGRINRANIVRCGDELCAKTGKSVENGYRVIQHR